MVLLLALHVLQHSFQLALTHREDPISTLPEKTAIASLKGLNPFRRWFLYLFNQPGLGKSSRQCCDNVNMIGNTADA